MPYALAVAALTIIFVLLDQWLEQGAWASKSRGPLRVRVVRLKNRIEVRATVDVAPGLDFEIRHENFFDRAAKSIGLSVEHQLGRMSFDDRYFLVSDEPIVRESLRKDPPLLALLSHIGEQWLDQFGLAALSCRDGELRVDLGRIGDTRREAEVLDQCERRLLAIAAALPRLPQRAIRADWARRRTRWVRAVVYGLFFVAMLSLAYEGVSPTTLGSEHVGALAFKLAAVILALLVLATLALLFRTSRVHVVLFEVLILGSIGAYGASHAYARSLNQMMESAPAEDSVMTVVRRWETTSGHGRRRSIRYHFLLQGESVLMPVRMEVSALEYMRYSSGERVRVRWHRGYLDDPWVEIEGAVDAK